MPLKKEYSYYLKGGSDITLSMNTGPFDQKTSPDGMYKQQVGQSEQLIFKGVAFLGSWSSSRFPKKAHFYKCGFDHLVFDKKPTHPYILESEIVTIWVESQLDDVTVYDCSIESLLVFEQQIEYGGSLLRMIDECDIESLTIGSANRQTTFSYGGLLNHNARFITLQWCKFESLLHFNVQKCEQLTLSNVLMNEFASILGLKSSISPGRPISLDFTSCHFVKAVMISNVDLSQCSMNDITVDGGLTFSDLDIDGETLPVTLHGVHFNELEFKNVTIKGQMNVSDVRIGLFTYKNLKIPKAIEAYVVAAQKDYEEVMKFAGLMAQFANKIGDRFRFMEWTALSNQAYTRYLSGGEDKVSLNFSQWLSHYGQSWTRPLKRFFLFSLIAYILEIIILWPDIRFYIIYYDVPSYLLLNFVKFLSPLRSINYLDLEEYPSLWWILYYVIDILTRAFQATAIWHFIRASRKFV